MSHSLDACRVAVPAQCNSIYAQGYQQKLEEHTLVVTRRVTVFAGVFVGQSGEV
jgi:hypothetical protein